MINKLGEAMYMSRDDIPSTARAEVNEFLKAYHIVPFRKTFVLEYASWLPDNLEPIGYNRLLRGFEKGHRSGGS